MSEFPKKNDQIFICYRREDSAWVTGRIYDRLVQRFGEETIFKDVDSIPLGTNFKKHIDSIIRQCSVVIVVIGDEWIEQETEKRRIDNPRDYVRIEIESALARDIPVIPLLVQNASMPSEEALPESLRELCYRNGISIHNDPHFHVDMNRLIKNLESYLTPQPKVEDHNLEKTNNEESNQIVTKGETGPAPISAGTIESQLGVAANSNDAALLETDQREQQPVMNRLIKNLESFFNPQPKVEDHNLEKTNNEESNQIVTKGETGPAPISAGTIESQLGVAANSNDAALLETDQREQQPVIEGSQEENKSSSEVSSTQDAYVPLLEPIKNIQTVEDALPLPESRWSHRVWDYGKRIVFRRILVPLLIVLSSAVILTLFVNQFLIGSQKGGEARLEVPFVTPSSSPSPAATAEAVLTPSPQVSPAVKIAGEPTPAPSSSPSPAPSAEPALTPKTEVASTISTVDVSVQWVSFVTGGSCPYSFKKVKLETNGKVFTATTDSRGVSSFQDVPCGAFTTVTYNDVDYIRVSNLKCLKKSIHLGTYGMTIFGHLFKVSAAGQKRIKASCPDT